MVQRLQIARSSVSNNRPTTGSRPAGELYVNFADLQLGVVLPSGAPQDLLGTPFFSESRSYTRNDLVVRNGVILRALSDILAGPFNAAQWANIEAVIPVTATAPSSPFQNDLWVDLSGTYPEFQYYDGTAWRQVAAGRLSLGGGTLTGSLGLPVNGGTPTTPALRIGATDAGLTFTLGAGGGLNVLLGGALVARTHHDALAPDAAPTADVLMTRGKGDARYAQLAGATMTGPLALSGAPTADLHAASKAYVDGKAGGATLSTIAPTGVTGAFWYDDAGVLSLYNGTTWVGVGGAGKVSTTGGAMTGHLSVPAGAANDQVPRASEVLLKAGGTLTGELGLSANGFRIPQRTNGDVVLTGVGAPADGVRFRFGGTNGSGGALSLTQADTTTWMTLTPSTQRIETSSRLLEIVGGAQITENLRLSSELTFTRTLGPAYITAQEDVIIRRGGTTVAQIAAAGTSSGTTTTVITREKGDARYLELDGTGVMTGPLLMGGQIIANVPRVLFTPAGLAEDYITWASGVGLQGFEDSAKVFELGGTTARIDGVYAGTTASAANVFVGADGVLLRSTSSRAVKTDIETLTMEDGDAVRQLNPVIFRSKERPDDGIYMGFIAEEVAGVMPHAAADGGKNYDVRAIAAMLTAAMQTTMDRVDALENRIAQ